MSFSHFSHLVFFAVAQRFHFIFLFLLFFGKLISSFMGENYYMKLVNRAESTKWCAINAAIKLPRARKKKSILFSGLFSAPRPLSLVRRCHFLLFMSFAWKEFQIILERFLFSLAKLRCVAGFGGFLRAAASVVVAVAVFMILLLAKARKKKAA